MVYAPFILEIVKAIPSNDSKSCVGNNMKIVKVHLMLLWYSKVSLWIYKLSLFFSVLWLKKKGDLRLKFAYYFTISNYQEHTLIKKHQANLK